MKTLTIAQYMDLTGLSRQTVNNKIKSKKLSVKREGRNVFIVLDDKDIPDTEIKKDGGLKNQINNDDKTRLEIENEFLKTQIKDLRDDINFLKNQLSASNARIDAVLTDKKEVNILIGTFQKAMGFLESKTDHSNDHILSETDIKPETNKKKKWFDFFGRK